MLKEKFTNHFSWEEPEWITRMSGEEFENKCKHEKGRGNVDEYEDNNHGLYSRSSPWINEIYNHWMYKIDL